MWAMDPGVEREARRLLGRYQTEVVAHFGLCPWAEPAWARGEVRVAVVDPVDAPAAITAFLADPKAVIGLVVLPGFDGDGRALRRLRDEVLGAHGQTIALADFHPTAHLDAGDAGRLVPWLRRSPDPMLQAVRHQTLSSLRRSTVVLSPAEQAAILAGGEYVVRPDPSEVVADNNLATVQAQGPAVAAVFDDIARDRATTYARLAAARASATVSTSR